MSKPFHIGVMDTVDAILLLLLLHRLRRSLPLSHGATPNSLRTTDRDRLLADRAVVAYLCYHYFLPSMFLGQELSEGQGTFHFYPEIVLACLLTWPPKLPHDRKVELRFVAWRVFARY